MNEEDSSISGRSVLASFLCPLIACGGASRLTPVNSPATTRQPPVTTPWCVVPGSAVDSAFAVAQARHLFDASSLALKPQSVERVVARLAVKDSSVSLSVPEGWLVRLMPVAKGALGGGGLVWVNGATGCPMLLIQYE
jgi:hypothetical protein